MVFKATSKTHMKMYGDNFLQKHDGKQIEAMFQNCSSFGFEISVHIEIWCMVCHFK